jgi:hypothetical protein
MANLGASAGWGGKKAETLTAAKTFTPRDGGKVFYITTTSTFANTLPKCSEAGAGWEMTAVAACNIAADISFTSAQNSDAMYGSIPIAVDAAGFSSGASTNDQVKFKSNSTQGDMVHFMTDGNDWYVHGQAAAGTSMSFEGTLSG